MEHRFSWSWVESQVSAAIAEWNLCATLDPLHPPRFSEAEQKVREDEYDRALRLVEDEAKRLRRRPEERIDAQRRIVAAFPRFAKVALGLEEDATHMLTDGFLPIGTQFAQWAKRFDPDLAMADTIQACRNAWTMCGIQPLVGDRMRLTPAVVGYSLLYPYTDNYLDDERIAPARKLDFSMRFRDRLCGLRLEPGNRQEAAVWAMVRLIEEQFPRRTYPQVYECLLAIHQAQEDSLAQLRRSRSRAPDLVRLSFAKGGTSVLADACLSHGCLNDAQSRFAFHWGVLLQLGDDLQDVHEDMKSGSATLFSQAVQHRIPLDSLVRQLLAFSDRVADQVDQLPDGDPVLKRLLRGSWRSLILMAVARSHRFFSPVFLDELERSSPFRFAFQRDRHKRLAGRRGLYKVLFDSFLASDADLPDLPCPEEWLRYAAKRECEQKHAVAAVLSH
ncbi:MAG TPA: hypothetical protein VGI45_34850 [Terracidiphilus sp.]|jgi:hypothetical protein